MEVQMEKINKISDEELEVVTERKVKIAKTELLRQKAYYEMRLADVEAMLENFYK